MGQLIISESLRDSNVYFLNLLELRVTHACNQNDLGTHRYSKIEVQK